MVHPLFLAHGSPMMAVEQNEYTAFLSELGKKIRPKAIVIFTAHWETEVLTISASDDIYETIYDFGGFPPELYTIKYPAKGSNEIAMKVTERFEQNGINVTHDYSRGLDHGSWVLLSRMYPNADIPVVQISVNPYLPAREQYKIGEALRGIGEEDILVIGSGVTVHNLRIIKWGQTTPEPWAVAFDDWLVEHIEKNDLEALFQYESLAPNAKVAVPRAEHFVPLFIVMGSGDPQAEAKPIHRHYDFGTLSYLCYQF